MADKPKFHPALAVANIKNCITITLEMEKVQYTSWAELFKIHCCVYQVLSHIIPSPPTATTTDKAAEVDEDLWQRLDAIVLQWIYDTISIDLMHTIIETNATAQQAWERLASIFQDNKNSRVLSLENQFNRIQLDDFPSISAYCQEIKMLADQLSNVGAPQFYEARSKLVLEESRKAKRTATNVDTALLTTSPPSATTQNTTTGSHDISFSPHTGQKQGSNCGIIKF